MPVDPLAFLRLMWQYQPRGYVFISVKHQDGSWTDHPIKLNPSPRKSRPELSPVPHLAEHGDLYFTPCVFKDSARTKRNALPSRWLYADLDEVDPATLTACPPTVAWLTSPGRYQCAWLLDGPLAPRAHARLNQKLTYYTGADKGGWSVTKVLRIPGTENTKYHGNPIVRLVEVDGSVGIDKDRHYSRAELARLTRDVETPADAPSLAASSIPDLSPRASRRILRDHDVGPRARKLLKATQPSGDRSQRLWELECLLARRGVKPEQIVALVRPTPWNKFAGQTRELRMLWTEANKAVAQFAPPPKKEQIRQRAAKRERIKTRSKAKTNGHRLDPTPITSFLNGKLPKAHWLVEGIWSETAHGLLAGEAKSYKSVIAMDLAVSVASGTNFLEYFPVPKTGPVLMIDEENDAGLVQDRLHRIAHTRHLGPSIEVKRHGMILNRGQELPLDVMVNKQFDLTDLSDVKWLARYCAKKRPKLVTLDPFYLMAPNVNENSQEQVTPVLRRLLLIKQRLGVGMLLVHHYNKGSGENPQQGILRMSGTGVFGRWFESSLLVDSPKEDNPYTVSMTPVHRGHGPQGVIKATFDLGTHEDLHYSVQIEKPHSKATRAGEEKLLDLIVEAGGEMPATEAARALDLSPRQVIRLSKGAGVSVKATTSKAGRRLMLKVL